MVQGHDGSLEEMQQVQDILNSMHVSELEGIAVTLAGKANSPDTVIVLFASCCGNSAYSMTLKEAEQMAIGLTRSIQKAKEFAGENCVN